MALNPLVKNGLLGGVVILAGWWAMNAYTNAVDEKDHLLELDRVKREFNERARWVASVAEKQPYSEELSSMLKWYFAELQDVNNRFPGRFDEDKAMKEAEQMAEKGRIKKDELPKYEEWFNYTKDVYERMKKGNFEPVLTGYSGTIRLDIYRLARDNKDGKAQLRMDFVLWGVPRRTVNEQVGDKRVRRTTTAVAFEDMAFKFLDEKGHIKFEMSGGGNPALRVDNPERWIATFPPQTMLGTYYLDIFPPSEKMEFAVMLKGTAPSGTLIPAEYKWDVPVDAAWKPGPGEKWEGDVREESEEYIERKE